MSRGDARRIAANIAPSCRICCGSLENTRRAVMSKRPKNVIVHSITCGGKIMSIQRLVVACAAAFAALMSASYAGPCSQGIDGMQAQFDAKLEANAAVGPSARESTAATMNRQPTPDSIAAAEAKLGEISPESVRAVEAGMARARDADRAGDQSTCEQALADVQRILGQ
jgi:hypothetical protein